MFNIEQYTRGFDLGYRLVSYFIYCFRRRFDEEIDKRVRQVVALETPKIFWTGFGVGAAFVILLLIIVYGSRQPVA
jgi:hypothetical protein